MAMVAGLLKASPTGEVAGALAKRVGEDKVQPYINAFAQHYEDQSERRGVFLQPRDDEVIDAAVCIDP